MADLPLSFGVSVPTAHRRFTVWTKTGVWRRLDRAVLDELDDHGLIDWSRAVVDAASVRALGGDLPGPNPVERAKPGSKMHALSDRAGIPLPVAVSGCQRPRFVGAEAVGEGGSGGAVPVRPAAAPTGQATRGQCLRPARTAAVGPPLRHGGPHRPQVHRIYPAVRPPPLGDQANHACREAIDFICWMTGSHMSHELKAVLGRLALLETLAGDHDIPVVALDQGFGLIPLTSKIMHTLVGDPTGRLRLRELDEVFKLWSAHGPIVHATNDVHAGGPGAQAARIWRDGALVFAQEGYAHSGPISMALLRLGVTGGSLGWDEFDVVGLNRHRKTSQWLDAALQRPQS
ncbi:hypothetical protein ACQP2U_23110 [Nocardia sp. CA-084685]|uniref:hypothetical protein n=1 Tax=Nocardia sp. CA-084685 TaxID=3239970 RepID=UPI003D95EE84